MLGLGSSLANNSALIFNPTNTENCVAWYDFTDIKYLWQDTGRTSTAAADGHVVKCADNKAYYEGPLKGNAACLGTGVLEASNPPKIKIENGIIGVDFDGTNDVLRATKALGNVATNQFSSTNLSTTATTVFYVIKSDVSTGYSNNACPWNIVDADTDSFFPGEKLDRWYLNTKQSSPRVTEQHDSGEDITTNKELWTIHLDSATDSSFYKNGLTTNGITNADTTNGTLNLDGNDTDITLAFGPDTGGTIFFNGQVFEFIVYSRALSVFELRDIQDSLMLKHGI
jgi:hypothetical protein